MLADACPKVLTSAFMEFKQKNTRDYSKFTWPYANWSEFSAQRSILMSLTDMVTLSPKP